MDLRSNLSKARGLGSAKEGSNHWLMQRITAIALIPLAMWFVSSVIKAVGHHGIEGVIFLLSSPFNAIAMILFLGAAIYHGMLGIKVIIEDYVHCPCGSRFLDIAIKFISVVSIVAVTFTIVFAHITSYGSADHDRPGSWSGRNASDMPVSDSIENPVKSGDKNNHSPMIEIETPKE